MSSRLTTLLYYFQPIFLEFHTGSVRWNQEGTPALPPWHPISTAFHQTTLYPLVNRAPYLVSRGWIPPKLQRASSYLQLQYSVNTHLSMLLSLTGTHSFCSCFQLYCTLVLYLHSLFGIPVPHKLVIQKETNLLIDRPDVNHKKRHQVSMALST